MDYNLTEKIWFMENDVKFQKTFQIILYKVIQIYKDFLVDICDDSITIRIV